MSSTCRLLLKSFFDVEIDAASIFAESQICPEIDVFRLVEQEANSSPIGILQTPQSEVGEFAGDITDTGERCAVELRNSVIVVHDGESPAEQAVVRLTTAQLNAAAAPDGTFDGCEITGDTAAATELLSLLDREVRGFSMHLR